MWTEPRWARRLRVSAWFESVGLITGLFSTSAIPGCTDLRDRGVILGRAPRVSEARETDRPNVVKLASPGKDISRSHLEVKIDGWHVFVVDLDSTNGTSVTLPGEPPRRLRPNDQLAIERGTVVELADEVTFTFDVIA